MASVKVNIVLNGINTLAGIIIPAITFPYAAHVLLPEGIGAINFLNSIVGYIVFLTSLGIPMYAVREIARCRDNKEVCNKTTVEIIILSSILCLFGYIVVWILAKFVSQIHEQSALFYILSLSIIFTGIGVNWFYQGIEDFKFITIRGIAIRVLSAAALFIFVKDCSDLLIYGLVIVGSTVGNNLINFIHLGKYIDPEHINWKELKVLRHLKPSLKVFILNLIISLYIHVNSVMLGFLSGNEAVGYFSCGTKISHIGLTIITSLGTALLPHCAHLIKTGQMESFESVIKKSLNVTLALSLPMTVGLTILAAPLTTVFCGIEFANSIPVLYLNAPVIIFISLTNLMGIQILYPMDRINIVIYSVTGGCVSNMILNFALIPSFGATGAAVATLVAEFAVLVIQVVCGKGVYPFKVRDIIKGKYLIGSLIMGFASYMSILAIHSNLFKLIIGIGVGIVVYSSFLIIAKDPLAMELRTTALNKLRYARKTI